MQLPGGSFKERRIPHKFSSYMALMSHIIDYEPSSYEEAANQQVGRDAMMEEYQSIMKNDVWDVVSRPKWKFLQMDLQDLACNRWKHQEIPRNAYQYHRAAYHREKYQDARDG